MLDNGAIIRITVGPLRLQNVFRIKAIMQTVCLKGIFMPLHCVNTFKSEVLSRSQEASQNVIARTHSGLPVVQKLTIKGSKVVKEVIVFCSILKYMNN